MLNQVCQEIVKVIEDVEGVEDKREFAVASPKVNETKQ